MDRNKNNGRFVLDENKKNERLGKIQYNNKGTLMKIVEYNNSRNVIVEFQDEYKIKVKTRYDCFLDGRVLNPYDKTVYNVGYIGVGKYNNKDCPKIYRTWSDMLKRCYDPYYINKHLTYIDAYVCNEWHNFQNFAKWYEENYYECNNERMNLDKDILIKGNKIYSPETCIFVTEKINKLFIKSDLTRGKYPLGVNEKYSGNILKLYVNCSISDEKNKRKEKFLGYFPLDKPFQAFTAYKNFKENYIKQVADEYKDLIPKELYEAMYNYKIEIND